MAAARPKLPDGFECLTRKEREKTVKEAALNKTDRDIARMYYINEIPQVDIAESVHMDRSTVSRRLPRIRRILEFTCAKMAQ